METQNGDYIAPQDSKRVIEGYVDCLIGHAYDENGVPVLIYSVDLMLDSLEFAYPMASEDQLMKMWEDIENQHGDSVVFCFT